MTQTPLTKERIADYFSAKLSSKFSVTKFKQSFPGLSRETWLVDAVVGKSETPKGFVLRLDPPCGGGVPQSLRQEYEVYKKLWASPVPVAEPLWYDEGQEFGNGRPLMVRDLVEGGTSIAGLTDQTDAGAKLREAVTRDHIERLAQIHTLDWEAYGFDEIMQVPKSPEHALRIEFETWKKIWLAGRTTAFPAITEGLYWLEENIPTDGPMISLTKGNNGVGEEIYQNNRIVALSDWELAGLSDGVLDLAFSQGSLAMHDFGASLAYYGECVGHPVTPQRLAWGVFWIMFKSVVCLNTLFLRRHLAGKDPRLASMSFGVMQVQMIERLFVANIGKDMVGALFSLAMQNASSTYAEIGAQE